MNTPQDRDAGRSVIEGRAPARPPALLTTYLMARELHDYASRCMITQRGFVRAKVLPATMLMTLDEFDDVLRQLILRLDGTTREPEVCDSWASFTANGLRAVVALSQPKGSPMLEICVSLRDDV